MKIERRKKVMIKENWSWECRGYVIKVGEEKIEERNEIIEDEFDIIEGKRINDGYKGKNIM